MDQQKKNKKINGLMREDYPFPFFQDLIAEIVIATSQYDKRALSIRYEQALKAILGKPKRPQTASDGHRDEDDAFRAAALINSGKTPNGEKISKTKACEEIARRRVLGKRYKFFGQLPLNTYDDVHTKIQSRAKAILRKLKEHERLKRSYFNYQIEKMLFAETNEEEVQMILDVFKSWKKRNIVKGQITKKS